MLIFQAYFFNLYHTITETKTYFTSVSVSGTAAVRYADTDWILSDMIFRPGEILASDRYLPFTKSGKCFMRGKSTVIIFLSTIRQLFIANNIYHLITANLEEDCSSFRDGNEVYISYHSISYHKISSVSL